MSDRLELLIPERRIRARTASLARQIAADYSGLDRPLGLVVVLKGAVVFAADLMRRLAIPATVDFVAAASYGAGTRSAGRVVLGGDERLDVGARHVLVVEDILDSGLTGSTIVDRLKQQRPASLALCALLRKPAAGAVELPVRYVGFDIPGDFVVGWGMDFAERYRNLPGVYRLVAEGAAR